MRPPPLALRISRLARVASSIAAEIGTMKVTEQIDALVTLSTNPLKYLALPRVLAATLAVPVLVAVGDAIGIAGGWIVGVQRLDDLAPESGHRQQPRRRGEQERPDDGERRHHRGE